MSKEDLKQLIIKDAYQYKKEPFTLASGKQSNHYFDCRQVSYNPFAYTELFDEIQMCIIQNNINVDAVAGIGMGAMPLIFGFSLYAKARGYKTYYPLAIRDSIKDHGKQQMVVGHKDLITKAILLEDVITTGGSALKAILALRKEGVNVNECICIIDRQEGGEENLSRIDVNLYSLFKKEEFKF